MSDLISRQAAINAINHICPVDTEYDCTLLDRVDVRCVLSDLPSAQPEIVRCKDCKYQEKFFHEDKRRKEGGYYIFGCELADEYSHVCLDDEFCSRAERRTDE